MRQAWLQRSICPPCVITNFFCLFYYLLYRKVLMGRVTDTQDYEQLREQGKLAKVTPTLLTFMQLIK